MNQQANDRHFVDTLIEPIRTCAAYTPKLGTNDLVGIGLAGFQQIYSADPLYHWALSPMLYQISPKLLDI